MDDRQISRWPRLKALRYGLANWLMLLVMWAAPDDLVVLDGLAKIARHNSTQAKALLYAD